MNILTTRLTDRPIVLQVAVIVVACLVLAQLIIILFVTSRYEEWDLIRMTPAGLSSAVTIEEMLQASTEAEREPILAAARKTASQVRLFLPEDIREVEPSARDRDLMGRAIRLLNPALEKRLIFIEAATPTAAEQLGRWTGAIRSASGAIIAFDVAAIADPAPPKVLVLLVGLTMTLPVVAISIWAIRVLTAPLSRLSDAAERFAVDLVPSHVDESGPKEIRKLAQAFNAMCDRIRDLVEHRSRMLAAVGHDLRTPLTRIRLRAEGLEPGEDRDRILRDTGTMNDMIGQALAYLRDEAAPLAHERLDLSSLVESVCDDFADSGADVSCMALPHVVVVGQTDMLTRAVSNLIDNAVKFGARARVEVSNREGAATIVIEDDGPGIEDINRSRVFEAFGRSDEARSGEKGGFGLGLTIARQIVEHHAGAIALDDALSGGLRVTVRLPLASQPVAGEPTFV